MQVKNKNVLPALTLIAAMIWFTTVPNEWLRFVVMPVFMVLVQGSLYKSRKKLQKSALHRLGYRFIRPDFWIYLIILSAVFGYYLWKLWHVGHVVAPDLLLLALFGHFFCTNILFRERYYLSIMPDSLIIHYPSVTEVFFDEILSVEYSPSEYVITTENRIYRIKLSELKDGEGELLRQCLGKET